MEQINFIVLPASQPRSQGLSFGRDPGCGWSCASQIVGGKLKLYYGRLLARVLKEGVQFWYNDTSTVKGGVEKTFLWKTFELNTLLHVSICSKLVRNFSATLGFVSLCRYACLLNYDIFIKPGTPSN
jgi:hypothetical protein